jgi:hypothetical protein
MIHYGLALAAISVSMATILRLVGMTHYEKHYSTVSKDLFGGALFLFAVCIVIAIW